MTTAGTPALNRPAPDRSEYQRRCEEALKVARKAMDVGSVTFLHAAARKHYALALRKIANLLEDR